MLLPPPQPKIIAPLPKPCVSLLTHFLPRILDMCTSTHIMSPLQTMRLENRNYVLLMFFLPVSNIAHLLIITG